MSNGSTARRVPEKPTLTGVEQRFIERWDADGTYAFDRTATLALIKTGKVPPPPEKWRDSAERGVQFRLYAKDKQ